MRLGAGKRVQGGCGLFTRARVIAAVFIPLFIFLFSVRAFAFTLKTQIPFKGYRFYATSFSLSDVFNGLSLQGGIAAFTAGRTAYEEDQKEMIEKDLKEAEDLFAEGEYHRAVKIWSDILKADSGNGEAREGILKANKKISKIRDFFGRDVFKGVRGISTLSLEECIEIGKSSSLLFQIADEQIDLSRVKVWQAKREFFPSLTLSYSDNRGISDGGKTEGVEYGLEAKQPLLRSGELAYTLAQARVNLNIAEMNSESIELDIYYDIAEAYYDFVKAKKNLNYIKDFYNKVKPFFELAGEKHKRGLIADIDYLAAESKFNEIYFKNISVESDYEIARLTLEQKLNIEKAGTVDVKTAVGEKDVDKDLTSCLYLAIENRPDLKIEDMSVKSAEYGKKVSQAKELPKLDFTGNYRKASEVYRQSYNFVNRSTGLDPHEKWYAGLEVTWPLMGSTGSYSVYRKKEPETLSTYHGSSEMTGRTIELGVLDNMQQFTDAEQAEVVLAKAREKLDETRKKIIKEVKDAFYGYEKARIKMAAAEMKKAFTEKEVSILKAKHRMGDAKISDLFDSYSRLLEAQESYLEAERGLYTSVAALNKSIGIRDYF